MGEKEKELEERRNKQKTDTVDGVSTEVKWGREIMSKKKAGSEACPTKELIH